MHDDPQDRRSQDASTDRSQLDATQACDTLSEASKKPAGKRGSTGPTSAAGKARSARNALRHGLNVCVASDPLYAAQFTALRDAFSEEATDDLQRALAPRLAEALIEQTRIRDARTEVLRQGAKHRPVKSHHVIKLFELLEQDDGSLEAEKRYSEVTIRTRLQLMTEFYATPPILPYLTPDLIHRLLALDRYDQRARSRLKRLIKAWTQTEATQCVPPASRRIDVQTSDGR